MVRDRQIPALTGPRARELLLVAAVYLGTALIATWPLAHHLSSRVPMGSEPAPTVPYFNLWTLGWNIQWWAEGGTSYWDAPIFHPIAGTFAFADPQPLTGLLAAPLWQHGPALAYNLVLLLFLTLDAVAVQRLLRYRGLGLWAALAGGLLAQWLPFLTHERGVLQLQAFFAVVWAWGALWRLLDRPRWRTGASLGLAVGVTFLTDEYYAVFLSLLLVPAALVRLRDLVAARAARALALAAGLALALIVPIATGQYAALRTMGFHRSEETIERFSASPTDYLRPSPRLHSSTLFDVDARAKSLSPGLALFVLGAAGAVLGWRHASDRRWTLYLLLAGGLAFLVSLGLKLSLAGWRPYELLRLVWPGFADLRSPFRLALVVQLCLALGAAQLFQRLLEQRRRALAAVLAAVCLIELAPRPARLTLVPQPQAAGLAPPVAFLPYVEGGSSGDYLKTVSVMCALLGDRTSLINGYSGYFPLLNTQLKSLLADFPTAAGLRALRALGTRTLLVEADVLGGERVARLERAVERGELVPAGGLSGLAVFEVPGARLRPASDYRGRWRVRAVVAEGRLVLRAEPTELGDEIYVMAPGTAALRWRVRVIAPDGERARREVSPANAQVLHAGARRWPQLSLPVPGTRGRHRIVLEDADTGRELGRTELSL